MGKVGRILLAVTVAVILLTTFYFTLRVLPKNPLSPTTDISALPNQEGRININTATDQQLQALPGIGPGLSDSIISYREENGPFQKVGDLIHVPGIGQSRLENILNHITVGGST